MARVTRTMAAAVTAIFAVLALAACGGGTSTKEKNAYAEKVNAAQLKFSASVTTAKQQAGGNSFTQQRRTLRRFEIAIDAVVRDLRAIKAPSDVSKEHQNLTTVMTDFGKAIGDANAAMRDPSQRGVEEAKRRLQVATESVNARVSAAIAAINVKLKGT